MEQEVTYTIRSMKDSDIDTVYAVETDVHIAPWSRGILSDCVLVGYDCRVLEIHHGEQCTLGGYIICRQSHNSYHILNFCIAKSMQSKGYGRFLLESLFHSLSELIYIDEIFLEVRPSNLVALHLYKAMGFVQDEIKPGYYKDGNSRTEDAIVLKKNIYQK